MSGPGSPEGELGLTPLLHTIRPSGKRDGGPRLSLYHGRDKAAGWEQEFSGQGQEVARRQKFPPRKEKNLGEGTGCFHETWKVLRGRETPAETWFVVVHGTLPSEFLQDRYPI